jgi:hypothetical protein
MPAVAGLEACLGEGRQIDILRGYDSTFVPTSRFVESALHAPFRPFVSPSRMQCMERLQSLACFSDHGGVVGVLGTPGGQALWPRAVSRSLLYSGVNTRARSPRFRPISDSSRSVIARSSARS